jgi:hypothetical protein
MSKTRLLISFTIALLGLAAAYGTMHYLAVFITFWPAVLAATGIELAYIVLATVPSSFEDDPDGLVLRTARWLVFGSVLMNFGHAYTVVAPGALTGTGRFETLAAVQALIVAVFVPSIAFRLSQVLTRIKFTPTVVQEPSEASEDLANAKNEIAVLRTDLAAQKAESAALLERAQTAEARARRVRVNQTES